MACTFSLSVVAFFSDFPGQFLNILSDQEVTSLTLGITISSDKKKKYANQ